MDDNEITTKETRDVQKRAMSKRRDIREEKAYRGKSAMLAGVDADRSRGH